MNEESLRCILKILVGNLIREKSVKVATSISDFVFLIRKHSDMNISDELNEIMDDLSSLHHYMDNTDFSLNDIEIVEIFENI